MSENLNWREVSIDVGWGVLRGKKCLIGDASGSPVHRIIGLHGWLDNANTFDRLVPLLPSGIEVFVLDFPGQGHSDHLPIGAHYNYMTFVVNVRAVVLKLEWTAFTFMAHSMGAAVASYYTALFPENVTAFIQLDFLKPYHVQERVATWRAEVTHILKCEQDKKTFDLYSEEEAVRRLGRSRKLMLSNDPTNIDRDSSRILLPRSTNRMEGGVTWSHDHKARARFTMLCGDDNWLYVIQRMKCPVLLVIATHGLCFQSDSVYKVYLDAYQANAKFFRHVVVEGNHHVHLTHPSRVGPSIHKFLSEISTAQKPILSKL